MSKIYEAMTRSQDEATGEVLSQLGQTNVLQNGSAAVAAAPALEPVQEKQGPPPLAVKDTVAPIALESVRTMRIAIQGQSPVLPFDNTNPGASELYRMIRTRIVHHPRAPKIIVITSPGKGDGKTVTAINLAGALSLKAGGVLLIDGDLRKSTVHQNLGFEQSPGLADVLEGNCTIEEAMVRSEQLPNFYVLTAGTRIANPAELLDSAAWRGLIRRVRQRFDYVMIDSPPIAAVADYDLIQVVCDGVVFIVRPDHSPRERCLKALRSLPADKLMGTVVNYADGWLLNGRSNQSDYYYGYGEAASEK